jgi:tRNA(Ile2) C34 agmatinyltransferase TiaS
MDDLDVATPRCPDCLTALEVAGTLEHPYWFCPSCKAARVSV